ncbi:GNAT family N-acetyltransferase [Labrys sp. KNU-23]|uniref:GNAT family N-acetyltransferase n=1 Tax=Labrys sp. KNU-23 TaxID=2789216 RepID=UPI0011EE1922|nr:GNAT family N-acetyltransferase [Labrys sp. KNU-23]QEN88366.1 GNAT family N-acetyltransferase [Labrys sp. KNU-23]
MRIRPATPQDCDAVAAMVGELAALFGVKAGTTGDILRAEACGEAPRIGIVVAEAAEGELAGYLVHQDSFSTWRGANGIFVVDLYVAPQWRNDRIGIRLLAEAARRGHRRGARFMRLDLDAGNEAGLRFYRRHGFRTLDHDRFLVLDEPGFIDLIEKS